MAMARSLPACRLLSRAGRLAVSPLIGEAGAPLSIRTPRVLRPSINWLAICEWQSASQGQTFNTQISVVHFLRASWIRPVINLPLLEAAGFDKYFIENVWGYLDGMPVREQVHFVAFIVRRR